MLNETHFQALSGAMLQHVHDQLEPAYDDELIDDLDYDEGAGILSIELPDGKTFILSKHGPSKQLWWASPLSGGLHFDYDNDAQAWQLGDGRTLKSCISDDLKQAGSIAVVL